MIPFRGMRWVTGAAAAVVMAACAVGAAAASAGHRSASPGCYPPGSTTIAQDKAGRFFVQRVRRVGPGSRQSWYVCAFKQGTPLRLPYGSNPDQSVPFDPSAKVAGRYVAFFLFGPGGSGVDVFDMVTGHLTFGHRDFGTDDVVLKPDASVAWIDGTVEVFRHDSTGTAIVDSGPGIEHHSLAAGGSWLYWTDDGSPRSAPFH